MSYSNSFLPFQHHISIGQNCSALIETKASGAYTLPFYIMVGPDGALWFTELAGNAIGRLGP